VYEIMSNVQSMLTVVQPSGALNAANAYVLQTQLWNHIASDSSLGLMVDMSQVESLDSAGLVSLISALRVARNLSKRFCLCSVPPSIRIVFELTQLDQVFEFIDDMSMQTA
jgi:anti-anti-sigma factor